MDLHTWLALLAASCVLVRSPGSGAVLSMGHGLPYGVRKTSATIAGLQLGLLVDGCLFFVQHGARSA